MSDEANVVPLSGAGNKLAALASNPEKAKQAVDTARQSSMAVGANAGSDGTPFLKLDQTSQVWSINRVAVEDGTRFAIDPTSMRRGGVCWKGGQQIEDLQVGVFDGQPEPYDPKQHGPFKVGSRDGWSDGCEFDVQAIGSPVKGRYSNTSMGAHRMFKELLDMVIDQIELGDGLIIPVVEFYSEKYYNKGYSKDITNPLAKVVGWSDIKGNVHLLDGAVEASLA